MLIKYVIIVLYALCHWCSQSEVSLAGDTERVGVDNTCGGSDDLTGGETDGETSWWPAQYSTQRANHCLTARTRTSYFSFWSQSPCRRYSFWFDTWTGHQRRTSIIVIGEFSEKCNHHRRNSVSSSTRSSEHKILYISSRLVFTRCAI